MFQTPRPLLAFVTVALLLSGPARAGQIELLSKAGVESATADGALLSTPLASSEDGRWIAFESSARNLVAGQQDPAPSFQDVFLHDRQTGTTVLASHAAGSPAVAGNGSSLYPSISADGRWIAYLSQAGNLVPGQDADPATQVFLYDRDTGTNTLVSHSAAGPSVESTGTVSEVQVSADGNWIAFVSNGTDLPGLSVPVPGAQLFLFERATGEITLASRAEGSATTAANGPSETPSLSADGRYLAFRSGATDLVSGFTDGDVNDRDVFLFDRVTGTMTLVSHALGSATHGAGGRIPAISADGSSVLFLSRSVNMVSGQTDSNNGLDLFLFDRGTGNHLLVSHSAASPTTAGDAAVATEPPRISADGAWAAFVSNAGNVVLGQVTSDAGNVFLFERATGTLSLVSRSSSSAVTAVGGSHPSLSADGSFVAFDSLAGNVVAGQTPSPLGSSNVFLYDRTTGTNVLASGAGGSGTVAGNGSSSEQVLSADGSVIAFRTSASDLTAGDFNLDEDVALFDRDTGTIALATLHAPGLASATPGDSSYVASVSADGRYAVLKSLAPNLAPGVAQPTGMQAYLLDRETGGVALVSHSASSPNVPGNAQALDAVISADGAWIAFTSFATDLVPGQVDGSSFSATDVFLYERATGTVTLVSHAAGFPATAGNEGCAFDDVLFGIIPTRLSISADGRYVAYECLASNLVAGQTDTNAGLDVFLHDRVAGQNSLVSRSTASAATAGNASSFHPVISPDGAYVAFSSFASNLIPGGTDGNGTQDVFLYDRVAGQTLLASRAAGTAATAANGASGRPAPSADGQHVVFDSNATNLVPGQADPPRTSQNPLDVFLFDRVTGTVELISRAAGSSTVTPNDYSLSGVPSADGRWVLFASRASNLLPGQAETGQNTLDLFVHDRVTRTTELITHAASSPALAGDGNATAWTISPDGNAVAFFSTAANLAPGPGGTSLFVADRQTRILERVAAAELPFFPGLALEPGRLLSGDGSTVFFASADPGLAANDFNGAWDAFAYVPATEPVGSDFFTLAPCRLLDTRLPEDGPALVSDHPELLTVSGACGIPDTAKALALVVTVVQPDARGRLTLHPGNLRASTSTLNFAAGDTRSNNAIVPLASNGERTLGLTPFVLGGGTVHVILDVTGYFE